MNNTSSAPSADVLSAAVPTIVSPASLADVKSTPPLYRLSVEQYHAMGAAGVFGSDARVELLSGLLVKKMNVNPPHVYAVGELADALRRLIPAGWHVREQSPITLTDSEPEPDVVVVRGIRADYRSRQPSAADLALCVEVADSSLREDQGIKKSIYAAAGVVEYWIVNIPDSRIEVYTQPSGPTESPDFRSRRDYSMDEEVPLTLDGATLGAVIVRSVVPHSSSGEE